MWASGREPGGRCGVSNVHEATGELVVMRVAVAGLAVLAACGSGDGGGTVAGGGQDQTAEWSTGLVVVT